MEKGHESLAHFANRGMGQSRFSILTMGGIAGHNVKARWRDHVNQLKLEGKDPGVLAQFEDQPLFWDHSLHRLMFR